MAHVRFQLKQVNGKSQIYFGDENQNKDKKKFTYKGRDQRFPLRGREAAPPPPPKEQGPAPTRSNLSGGPKASRAPPKRTSTGGADTVTLTQDQLQLILNSVGKTAASDRENSVRISVERTEGGLNIETKASPRRQHGGGDSRRVARRRDDDEDSAFGDASGPSDLEEERPAGGRRGGGKARGENILGLLGGGAKPDRSVPKPKAKPKAAEAAGVTMDADEKMRRIIAENKGKMKESELVDLLAAVYMEERKKQLGIPDSEGGTKEARGKGGRGRHEEDRAPASRRAGRKYRDDDDDEDEEERRPRGRGRGGWRRDDDEEEALSRRRGIDVDDEDNRRPRDRRRRYDSDEEDRERDRRRDQKARGRRDSEEEREEGKKEEEKKEKAEHPKFLTAVEKKRLQWEKEREENAKIKEYDPWNRPGAGAPPKDYFSDASTAMKKKEEEQQRYARELDAQRREKEEMEAARRGAAGRSEDGGGGVLGAGSPLNSSGTFARGRGVANLDEKSTAEQEDRRKRQVEHQEAIKRQVEEQQAKRAQERQRRIEEELREEAKLQRERDCLQRQYEEEQVRTKRREAEQETRLAQLQAANEAAEAAARFDRAQRRLQHLETSGHDTSGLRASLEAQLTSRTQTGPAVAQVRHAAVPGLEGIAEVTTDPGSGRWATPREVKVFGPPQPRPEQREDHQVQTDASLLQPIIQRAVEMAMSSSAQARALPLRHQPRPTEAAVPSSHRPPRKIAEMGEKESREPRFERGFVLTQKGKASVRSRAPLPVQQRPRWGAANPQGRRTLPQSEREVGAWKRQDREQRRARRQAELLAEMEANQHHVPGGTTRRTRQESPANWPGPEEGGLPLATYNLEREEPQPRTGRLTPPLPSRRRFEPRGGPLATSRSEENLAVLSRPSAALPPDTDLGIVRTSEILNPAAAARPLPVSRENTERQLARKTYLKGLNPAHFGEHMSNLEDGFGRKQQAKNPILNPGLVKDIPTPRQDAILQHLSDIRKNLLLKQREIETSLSLGADV